MSTDGRDNRLQQERVSKAKRLPRFAQRLIENSQLEADRRMHRRSYSDRRRDDRASVDAAASLHLSLQDGTEGRLFNLSVNGCSLELPSVSFSIDDEVVFTIDAVKPWKGRVRWINEGKFGIEFERPFFPALFELIVQMKRPVACAKAA